MRLQPVGTQFAQLQKDRQRQCCHVNMGINVLHNDDVSLSVEAQCYILLKLYRQSEMAYLLYTSCVMLPMPVYLMISEEAVTDAPSCTKHQNSYPAGDIQCVTASHVRRTLGSSAKSVTSEKG